MTVDPLKPRRVLVLHGVESGENRDQDQHVLVRRLLLDRLNGIDVPFDTVLFPYEDLNDQALESLNEAAGWLRTALEQRRPLAALAVQAGKSLFDIVGDVLIARRDGPVARAIRKGIRDVIMASYDEGRPLYIVAHSLGSLYAFDVIQELMATQGLFARDQRRTWPVQGLVTIGSPIGLGLFGGKRPLHPLGEGRKFFRWHNFWSRTDPVVSGSFYGDPGAGYQIVERFQTAAPKEGWIVQDHVVDTGFAWLLAHTSYWSSPEVGDALVHLITH